MKVFYKSFIIAALVIGSPLLAHAGSWSCPPSYVNAFNDEHQCVFANHGRKALDVTIAFHNPLTGQRLEFIEQTVPPNGSVVLENFITPFPGRNCRVTFRGSKRDTSAAIILYRDVPNVRNATACQ